MVLKYKQEFLVTFVPDVLELVERDWLEVQHDSSTSKLDPDWDSYKLLEDNNSLYVFTCRDNDKLVGYFTVFILPNLHSKGSTRAVNDAIFLDKPYRKGFAGIKLIKFAESCIRDDGHKMLSVSTTEINPIDSLMVRLGYYKVSTSFEKVL